MLWPLDAYVGQSNGPLLNFPCLTKFEVHIVGEFVYVLLPVHLILHATKNYLLYPCLCLSDFRNNALQLGDSRFEPLECVRYTRDQLLEMREVLIHSCSVYLAVYFIIHEIVKVTPDASWVTIHPTHSISCCNHLLPLRAGSLGSGNNTVFS